MMKFLQWSLVTIVAIVLLAAVVGQILASSTGRAREASVAVLKEKLARLEAERVAEEPLATSELSETKQEELPLGHVESAGEGELRARWLALFDELDQTWRKCGFEPPQPQDVLVAHVYGVGEGGLDAPQLQALSDYRACIAPTAATLVRLLQESGNLDGLFTFKLQPGSADYDEQLWFCGRLLNMCFWMDATVKDYPGMVDAYAGKVHLSGVTLVDTAPWTFEPTLIWNILDKALVAETVDPARWDRLLEVLESRRAQELFLEQVRRDTEGVIFAFETWKDSDDWGFRFSDDPIGYMRTWAYPRLTPALFNHDFDRFNRAMDRLLELAPRPYFEVKDDLEQFCADFDVEPNLESIKFTRTNPGWVYVLELSRHEFEGNARDQAVMDVIRIAILLDRHKRTNGDYPESLEVFTEALGGSLPVNPLMGEGYVYERTDDSFRLGFRQETHPDLLEHGFAPIMVKSWYDPLGVETEGMSGRPKGPS